MRPSCSLRSRAWRRAVLTLLIAVSVLSLSACTTTKDAVIDWSLGPVQLSLAPDGRIQIEGQAAWVTPIGRFSVGKQFTGGAGGSELILDIRHLVEGEPVDDIYKIPTSADVKIDMEGRVQLGLHGREVLVDATGASVREIVLTGVTWQMPDFTGANLQDAQNRLEKFTGDALSYTSTYDASGRGRSQTWDTDWKVCTQSVPPGHPVTADSTVGFGVVETDEECPNGSVTTPVVWTLPAFAGKSLDDANGELRELTSGAIKSAHSHDATGAGKSQYTEAEWTVCYQMPSPGSAITAATPVEFAVVARDTRCPATPY